MKRGNKRRSRRRRRREAEEKKKEIVKSSDSDESSSTDEEAEMQIIKKLYMQKDNSAKKSSQNQDAAAARQKLVEERGIGVICKKFLKNMCNKDFCPNVHDRSLYPCPDYYTSGDCQFFNNCSYSHKPFMNERDIYEFIQDNEHFLVNVLKNKRETILGYYFIKHLTNLKMNNKNKFLSYGVQLPNQMPPYISPRLISPKKNFQYKNYRGGKMGAQPGPYAFQNPNAGNRLMMQNRTPPSMNTMSRLGINQQSISPLQQYQTPQSINKSRSKKSGKFSNPLGGRYSISSMAKNQQISPHNNQNALFNANSFNRANLLHNFNQASNPSSGNKMETRSKSNKKMNKASSLIHQLNKSSSGKKLIQNSGNKNMLLSQLNLAGRIQQPQEIGYLAKHTQNKMYSSLGMSSGQKTKTNRDKIERIFSRMKIPKNNKDSREKNRKLRQKMMELRKIVFENRDDQANILQQENYQ